MNQARIDEIQRFVSEEGQIGYITAQDLLDEIARLQAVVDKFPKDGEGKPVQDGQLYYSRCANGFMEMYAYLSPQFEKIRAYNWKKNFSSIEAAEAANKKENER